MKSSKNFHFPLPKNNIILLLVSNLSFLFLSPQIQLKLIHLLWQAKSISEKSNHTTQYSTWTHIIHKSLKFSRFYLTNIKCQSWAIKTPKSDYDLSRSCDNAMTKFQVILFLLMYDIRSKNLHRILSDWLVVEKDFVKIPLFWSFLLINK